MRAPLPAIALACALSPAVLGAVQDASPPIPTLRITVTLVQVDAVVTDSAGRRVTGLRPEDFEILQDGQPQQIKVFQYSPEASRAASASAPPGPALPIAPAEVNRTIALVVDDLALEFSDLVRAREAIRQYVNRNMQRGDLVAILRTGGGIAMLEQFTTDKRVLLEAVDTLRWRYAGRVGIGAIQPIEPQSAAGRASPENLDYGYSLASLGAIGTLEEVIRGMKALPGRKSVVFLSSGLGMNSAVSAALDRLTDLANRSAVSIYTVDPGGLRASDKQPQTPATADPNAPRLPTIFSDEPIPDGMDDTESRLGALADLSARTGGLSFRNRNDIAGCVDEAARDQSGYYLLGYTPPEKTFDSAPATSKFHRVVVRVRRPGLHVRWKSGFNGIPDDRLVTEGRPESPEQQIVEALASPFRATGIDVRLTSIFYHNAKDGPFVYSMLYIDGHGLTFTQQPNGEWLATVDIVTLAYRGLQQDLIQHQRVRDFRLSDDNYHKALKEGFLYRITDIMKQPGPFLLRAVIRDHTSQRVGSASQFVEVPDTRKSKLALTGILLSLVTPEMVPALGIEPRPTQPRPEGPVEPWTGGGPAVRRYLAGQDILYGYVVVNPKLKSGQPHLISQVHLYANGKLVYTGPEVQTLARAVDTAHVAAAGVLRLGSALPKGEFLLQVSVTDTAAKKKPTVSQFIDFEVTSRQPATAAAR